MSLTKRRTLIYSMVPAVGFFVFYFVNKADFCDLIKNCSRFNEILIIYTLPFISVLIFSLITYRLKELTFSSWKNFSLWAIPFSLILITFLPTRTHGLDFVPVTKGTVIFFLTILYSIISLILIVYKSFKKK